ncbi:MAG: class II fructose-bisphosphate aldolase [Planctomycetia bacterium]|nr:class II fructose-bisphosphate aldolase [Planctomycetia bacterium]
MPLVNTRSMLRQARDQRFCIGAFNIVDFLTIEAVVEAAEHRNAPAIIQTSSGTLKRFGVPKIVEMVRIVAENSKVPIALHLDHGTDLNILSEAIRSGFNSVMIDASSNPFEENIRLTRQVVEEAKQYDVSVEGEIGIVAGVEDEIVISQNAAIYTTPEEALLFEEKTGIDFLAAAIGTAHGFYKVEPRLNIQTLRDIHQKTTCPLVVHGGTGLDDETVKSLVEAGASKFNVSTRIKQVYIDAMNDYIQSHRQEYNILKVLAAAKKELVSMLEEYIVLLGGEGQGC